MPQSLKRLAPVLLPPVLLGYGIYHEALWAQNLFTGWAVFLLLAGIMVCIGIPVMAAEEPDKLREYEVLAETDWIRVLGRITAIGELAAVVAMGWWWTSGIYAIGWFLQWFAREMYKKAIGRIEDDSKPTLKEHAPN